MSGCVLDADALIPALDRRDAHHAEAAAAIREKKTFPSFRSTVHILHLLGM